MNLSIISTSFLWEITNLKNEFSSIILAGLCHIFITLHRTILGSHCLLEGSAKKQVPVTEASGFKGFPPLLCYLECLFPVQGSVGWKSLLPLGDSICTNISNFFIFSVKHSKFFKGLSIWKTKARKPIGFFSFLPYFLLLPSNRGQNQGEEWWRKHRQGKIK